MLYSCYIKIKLYQWLIQHPWHKILAQACFEQFTNVGDQAALVEECLAFSGPKYESVNRPLQLSSTTRHPCQSWCMQLRWEKQNKNHKKREMDTLLTIMKYPSTHPHNPHNFILHLFSHLCPPPWRKKVGSIPYIKLKKGTQEGLGKLGFSFSFTMICCFFGLKSRWRTWSMCACSILFVWLQFCWCNIHGHEINHINPEKTYPQDGIANSQQPQISKHMLSSKTLNLDHRAQHPALLWAKCMERTANFFNWRIEYLAMWGWEQGIKDWDLICCCQEKGELESLSTFEVGRAKVFTSLNGDPSIVQRHLLQLQHGLHHADPNNRKPCGLAPQLMQTHGPGSSNHKKQRVRSTCAIAV